MTTAHLTPPHHTTRAMRTSSQAAAASPRRGRIKRYLLAGAEAEAEAEGCGTAADSPMAGGGWLPLELSLATAGAPAGGEGGRRRGEPGQRGGRRRTTVSSLYAELGALLPNLPPGRPASREEIVDAAVAQVKVLEDTAAVLEACRAVREPRAAAEVAVCGATVCFSARLPAPGRGALARVLEAFHRRGVEVLAATVARHGGAAVVTVTAAAAGPGVLEMVRADIARIS